MKKIISELYYGNISPSDQVVMEGSDYTEAMKIVIGAESFIESKLDKPGLAAFRKYISAYTDLISITSCEMFTQGFRLGLRMGVEVMSENDGSLKELVDTLE